MEQVQSKTVHNRECPIKITRRYCVSDGVWSEIEPLILKWLWVVPKWVSEVCVHSDWDSDSVLNIFVDQEYRRVEIGIGKRWSDCLRKEESVLHELCHCYNAVIGDVCKSGIEKIMGSDFPNAASNILDNEIRKVTEGVNCDLCDLIFESQKQEC